MVGIRGVMWGAIMRFNGNTITAAVLVMLPNNAIASEISAICKIKNHSLQILINIEENSAKIKLLPNENYTDAKITNIDSRNINLLFNINKSTLSAVQFGRNKDFGISYNSFVERGICDNQIKWN